MRGNVAQQLFDFCPHGSGSKERQVLTKMDQTTDKKNVAAAPIDAKVDMVAKLAGVDGLKLVSSAAGGTQVFVGSCTADGLRGTSCSLKLIRGDIDHLRRQGDFFCRVSDTQADAGGTLTPSSHGLARVLFHELVALPGDDAVLAVVTVMVPGVSFADVVRTCATGVRTLSFAQSLLLVSSCFKALAQAQAAFGGTFVHQDLKPSNIVFESDPFDLAPDLLGDIPRAALIDLDFSFLAEEGAYRARPHGTPGYLAPELLLGETDGARYAAPASDVFSLGVLAHEALCGSLPYLPGAPDVGGSGGAWRDFLGACRDTGAEAIAVDESLPADVRAAIAACLASDPDARPKAAQMARVFDDLARRHVQLKGDFIGDRHVMDVVTPVTLL